MLSLDAIYTERRRLQQVCDALTPLTEFFKTSAASQPLSIASYDSENQKQAAQKEIKNALVRLSDERSEIILEEIAISLRASQSALNRVHLLLHNRLAIYTDGDVERCARDVLLHQNQSGFHIERASGILPTAQSHATGQKAFQNVRADIDTALAQYQKSMADIEDQSRHVSSSAPSSSADIADARELYAQIAFDLGQLNREVIEKASERIRNALAYVELINVGLIPYDMGDEEDWSRQKVLLLQESLNSFNTFLDHINGAKGYLVQAENFATPQ